MVLETGVAAGVPGGGLNMNKCVWEESIATHEDQGVLLGWTEAAFRGS